jgi:ABC-type phosphate/phosphonate transport system substrate-binding protein
MIANASMYSVTEMVGKLWRQLFADIATRAVLRFSYQDHSEACSIAQHWGRPDKSAVFMCGLPFARSQSPPVIVAAPVPLPADFAGEPKYWSEFVVRADSPFQTLEETFGHRIALTRPDSQSGCWSALHYLMGAADYRGSLYREVIAPQITPARAVSAVVNGLADVTPVDAYAFCLLQKYRPELTSRVRVIGRTPPTAIPPLVASLAGRRSLEPLFLEAHDNPRARAVMTGLLLKRFVHVDPSFYEGLRTRFETASRFWKKRPLASVVHPAFAAL